MEGATVVGEAVVGVLDGEAVGVLLGDPVGVRVGDLVGLFVGVKVGVVDGALMGDWVGFFVVGVFDGEIVGVLEGERVGDNVGGVGGVGEFVGEVVGDVVGENRMEYSKLAPISFGLSPTSAVDPIAKYPLFLPKHLIPLFSNTTQVKVPPHLIDLIFNVPVPKSIAGTEGIIVVGDPPRAILSSCPNWP